MEDRRRLISIIVPARDEEGNVGYLLDDIWCMIRKTQDYEFEVIVVNDHSRDKTPLVASLKNVKVIDNLRSPGKGHALITGFENAKGDYFVMMDADYSHRAEDIPELIKPLDSGAGLVIGSRIYGGSDEYTRLRAFGNVILTLAFGIFHKRYLSDALNGFKAFKSEIFRNFSYTAKDFEIEVELLVNTLRAKMAIVEIPSHERSRRYGMAKSKIIKHGFKFIYRIILEWSRNKFSKV